MIWDVSNIDMSEKHIYVSDDFDVLSIVVLASTKWDQHVDWVDWYKLNMLRIW